MLIVCHILCWLFCMLLLLATIAMLLHCHHPSSPPSNTIKCCHYHKASSGKYWQGQQCMAFGDMAVSLQGVAVSRHRKSRKLLHHKWSVSRDIGLQWQWQQCKIESSIIIVVGQGWWQHWGSKEAVNDLKNPRLTHWLWQILPLLLLLTPQICPINCVCHCLLPPFSPE